MDRQALDTWLGMSGGRSDTSRSFEHFFSLSSFRNIYSLPSISLQNPDTNNSLFVFFFLIPCHDGFQNFHLHLDHRRWYLSTLPDILTRVVHC